MADKLGLGTEVRELKLGPSFSNSKSTSFHTIRYDFKPASVDLNKMATVDIGNGNEVTVTVPHLDGAGTSHTVFRGSQRPYQKECVLIFDHNTGEVTLEKLTYNIQVKKTRMESSQKVLYPAPGSRSSDLLHSTQKKLVSGGQKTGSKKKTSPRSQQLPSSLTGCIPKHSPLHASPSYPSRSPTRAPYRSPQNLLPAPASSLPLISVDDVESSSGPTNRYTGQQDVSRPRHSPDYEPSAEESRVLPMSSDSSSDSASTESESEAEVKATKYASGNTNGHVNGTISPALSMQDHLLKEDLQLSESGSDSD